MGCRTLLSRADLLLCIATYGEDRLDALADVLGYEPEEATAESAQPKTVSISHPTATAAPAARPAATPQAPFYHLVEQRRIEAEEVRDQPPAWFRQARPLHPSQMDPAATRTPPRPPLMPWSRLWPFLKAALGRQRAGRALDLPRVVALLAQGKTPRRLPRRSRTGWTGDAQVVVDYAPPLLPFWEDFNHCVAGVRHLRGEQGLTVLALPDGDPGGRCWTWTGKDWRDLPQWPDPVPGSPVLVLGDLGCIDRNDLRRRRWRRVGRGLQRRQCRSVALMPCPSRWWDGELNRLFLPVCWDRGAHPPRHLEGCTPPPAPALRPSRDEGAERLLALLAAAIRVEPALLRAVRQCLPAGLADVGSEAAVWNHPDVQATPLAFCVRPAALAQHQANYQHQDPSLRRRVNERVEAYHAVLCPSIVIEERWRRAVLEGENLPAEAARFMASAVKAMAETRAGWLADWVQRLTPRQSPDTWRDDHLAAAWAAANLPALQAGRAVSLPEGLSLARVAWLLGRQQEVTRYDLRQHGEALVALSPNPPERETDFVAPGSPVTDLYAASPWLAWRWEGEGEGTRSLDEPLPLSRQGGCLHLYTDRQELMLKSLTRPAWAEDIGRDEYGLYAGFRVKGVYQRMRWIGPGEFWMGSPEDEPERRDNETRHRVILTQGYWLADTACTQALWEAVMGNNPSHFQGAQRPVEQVSWEDVERFLDKLNQVAQERGFRLPTEAQWEYACRAGTQTPFWFGDNVTPEQANYNGDYPYDNGPKGQYRKETVEVKALPCNGWGLYQMHGNVWEWCTDGYSSYDSGTAVDPVGPDSGEGRVLRGGGWFNHGRHLRSACRDRNDPGFRFGSLGFRLALGQAS